MIGEKQLEWQGVKYPLRLTFAAIRHVERETGKSIIKLDSSVISETVILLAACAEINEDTALEILRDVGIMEVTLLLKTLVIETFEPEPKKSKPATKKNKAD